MGAACTDGKSYPSENGFCPGIVLLLSCEDVVLCGHCGPVVPSWWCDHDLRAGMVKVDDRSPRRVLAACRWIDDPVGVGRYSATGPEMEQITDL